MRLNVEIKVKGGHWAPSRVKKRRSRAGIIQFVEQAPLQFFPSCTQDRFPFPVSSGAKRPTKWSLENNNTKGKCNLLFGSLSHRNVSLCRELVLLLIEWFLKESSQPNVWVSILKMSKVSQLVNSSLFFHVVITFARFPLPLTFFIISNKLPGVFVMKHEKSANQWMSKVSTGTEALFTKTGNCNS